MKLSGLSALVNKHTVFFPLEPSSQLWSIFLTFCLSLPLPTPHQGEALFRTKGFTNLFWIPIKTPLKLMEIISLAPARLNFKVSSTSRTGSELAFSSSSLTTILTNFLLDDLTVITLKCLVSSNKSDTHSSQNFHIYCQSIRELFITLLGEEKGKKKAHRQTLEVFIHWQ